MSSETPIEIHINKKICVECGTIAIVNTNGEPICLNKKCKGHKRFFESIKLARMARMARTNNSA